MANHAPARIAIHCTPLFSPPATSHAARIPRWTQLDAELQQALIGLLIRMIGDHLPESRARKGDADEPR